MSRLRQAVGQSEQRRIDVVFLFVRSVAFAIGIEAHQEPEGDHADGDRPCGDGVRVFILVLVEDADKADHHEGGCRAVRKELVEERRHVGPKPGR